MTGPRDVAGPFLFPPDAFPITLRAYRTDNGREVWSRTLTADDLRRRPGALTGVEIPPLAQREGVAVTVEVEYANGRVERAATPADDLRGPEDR